jgi:putative ABC transport system ATP-binding protein
MRARTAVFKLRDVAKTYKSGNTEFRLTVSRLDVLPGSKLAFVGESGSGKSTLLELLAMILQPTDCTEFHFQPQRGNETYDIDDCWRSESVDRLSDLRSRYIGYVLQSGGLLPYLTVRENINLSLRLLHLPLGSVAEQLAERLKIADQLEKLPAKLSVGQRQRAAIARALAHEPPVVIADEPTAAIDPINAERIVQLFVNLADEMGVTLILASHAQELVTNMGFSRITHEIITTDDNHMTVSVSGA